MIPVSSLNCGKIRTPTWSWQIAKQLIIWRKYFHNLWPRRGHGMQLQAAVLGRDKKRATHFQPFPGDVRPSERIPSSGPRTPSWWRPQPSPKVSWALKGKKNEWANPAILVFSSNLEQPCRWKKITPVPHQQLCQAHSSRTQKLLPDLRGYGSFSISD